MTTPLDAPGDQPSPTEPEAAIAAPTASADQLPEYEPLTPELVEDEAIRGDFVIRWATVLLAVLLGWTQVSDTSLLVRIRNAQQHLLPFGLDTFSVSAADRSWHNLGWLVDPILAATYGVLGATGLTLLGALTAGVTFWALSKTSVRSVSTWWGSICGAIALIAAFPHLTPGPASLNLLGTALLIHQLYCWTEDRSAGFTWKIPALLWIWSQLDSEAWVGPVILVLFAASWVGLRGSEPDDDPQKARNLGKLTGAGLLAWIIHPMHYHVLLSPITAFRVEYPELRAYKFFDLGFAWEWYSVISPEFSLTMDIFAIASLLLCALALITFAINFKRLTWEWVLPWAGIVALAGLCAHLLPVAGIVSCAVATLNAQIWYRATFSQQYTLDSMPLLWNRGGRAITVLSLLLLGIMASNGMLMGRDGRRIGAGFSPRMTANIAGAEKVAREVQAKEVFNFRIEQGDLLIWAGMKPYVDRRLTLYTQGPINLLEQHRKLRKALLPAISTDKEYGKPEFWKAEFDRLNLNQAIPRLSEPSPDYLTMVRLQQQGWVLSSLESFGAVLSRPDSPNKEFQKYLTENPGVDFAAQTFRREPAKEEGMNLPWVFPRRPTVYDTWLWQPQPMMTEAAQLAAHEQKIVDLLAEVQDLDSLVATTSLALSAFRHARAGVAADPQSAPAYRVMARSAQHLFQVETNIARTFNSPHSPDFWIYHALHAYQHALQIDPDSPEDHEGLALLQLARGKLDLALQHLQQVYRLTGVYTTRNEADPLYKQEVKDREKLVLDLKVHVRKTEDAVLKVPANGGTWDKALTTALQGQCPGLALRVLEENRTKAAESLDFQVLRIGVLMDVGRTENAIQEAASLNQMIPQTSAEVGQPRASDIRVLNALANLSVGDNSQVEKLVETEARIVAESAIQELLSQAPMASAVSLQMDLLPASQAFVTAKAINTTADRWASLQLMIAQSELSTGRNRAALARLQLLLETEPDNLVRPVVAFYVQQLSGKECSPVSPEMLEMLKKASENAPPAPSGPALMGPAPAGPAPAAPPAGTPAPETPPSTPAAPPQSGSTP